jgi:hypothetical protein
MRPSRTKTNAAPGTWPFGISAAMTESTTAASVAESRGPPCATAGAEVTHPNTNHQPLRRIGAPRSADDDRNVTGPSRLGNDGGTTWP